MINKKAKLSSVYLLAFICVFSSVFSFPAKADNYVITNKITGASIPIVSSGNGNFQATLHSTSVDWEAVTGLSLREYNIKFIGTNITGINGWEMYYLDAFPCYGYAQYVRAWVSMDDKEGNIRINCVRAPREIMLAMREAKKDDSQNVTKNLLKCKVSKDLSVALDKCEKTTWDKFVKEYE